MDLMVRVQINMCFAPHLLEMNRQMTCQLASVGVHLHCSNGCVLVLIGIQIQIHQKYDLGFACNVANHIIRL